MRIFKVKKSHEKSRRYVKQRIYGFSVFSDICTFVQRGVETDDTRRILCLRKLKSSTRKKVRQCDRNGFLTFRFSGSYRYFAVLSGVFNVITYTVSPSVPVRQCDNATGIVSEKFPENKNTQVQREVIKNSGTTVIAVPLTFTASYKTHIHNRPHGAEVPQPIRESAPLSDKPAQRKYQERILR